ncbi:MAG: 16S rRNA (adenine(1518)-N(6)/adenine(1519)-N(6))-dimethyltransferase RsmA [Bacteroidia bacterium]|nr:16S rRNA (adenine(1518)-N(6)/adenine(1519)-N(6))-dimethyltransferase RsmA [Bacteroidia bacterium]
MDQSNYTPKKSLGQHFLHDMNIARKIVEELRPAVGDTILEIGPGKGVLTGLLVASGARVVAADIDERSIEALRDRFPANSTPNLRLLHADILDVALADVDWLHGVPVRVIGNLPYNITSQILFRLFDQHERIRDAVFMMQREVADRLVAPHGGKDYGILSVVTQVHARVHRCFHVSPNVFTPRPKVWSSVVHLDFHGALLGEIRNYSFFRSLVKATFGKRRKTLANTLRFAEIDSSALQDTHADWLALRPEQLAIGDFITLSNILLGYERRTD